MQIVNIEVFRRVDMLSGLGDYRNELTSLFVGDDAKIFVNSAFQFIKLTMF